MTKQENFMQHNDSDAPPTGTISNCHVEVLESSSTSRYSPVNGIHLWEQVGDLATMVIYYHVDQVVQERMLPRCILYLWNFAEVVDGEALSLTWELPVVKATSSMSFVWHQPCCCWGSCLSQVDSKGRIWR